MTSQTNTAVCQYNNISNWTRLVLSTALVGMIAGFTHSFYLGVRIMPIHRLAKASATELETHTGDEYHGDSCVVDPRRVKGIKRDDYS